VLPYSAALAGRLLGARLLAAKVMPVLAIVGAFYLLGLLYEISQPQVPAQNQRLESWLVAHHLRTGLSGYWQSNIVTLTSGGRVRIRLVTPSGTGLAAGSYESKADWYNPAHSTANFVVLYRGIPGFAGLTNTQAVLNTFGEPARAYHVGPYEVLVWNRNLLSALRPAGLSARVLDVHRRQLRDLLLGEVELDTLVDLGHGADGDGHFLAAPQMPFGEEHVGHVMAVRVDDEAMDPPDLAVGGVDPVAAADLEFAGRDGVGGDLGAPVAAIAVIGPEDRLLRAVGGVLDGALDELRLRGGVERGELRHGAAKLQPGRGGVDQVDGNKPGGFRRVLRPDDEMGELAGDRVDHHTAQRAARSVGAAGFGPDRKLLR
jgi:hypothetical protein